MFSPSFPSISSCLAIVPFVVFTCRVVRRHIRAPSSSPNCVPYHRNPSEVSRTFRSLFARFAVYLALRSPSSLRITSSPVLSRLGENFLGLLRICWLWFCVGFVLEAIASHQRFPSVRNSTLYTSFLHKLVSLLRYSLEYLL